MTETLEQKPNLISGVIRLSRWKEHLPLVTLTFLGGLVAFSVHDDVTLDWRLIAVAIANFLTVTFAFMINDMEDAPDDAENPISAKRNPVTNGSIDLRTAWIVCALVVLTALALYSVGGLPVILVGLLNLTLSFLYSWKPVRLKSSTVGLDIVSHTLMLGGLLPLAGYFAVTAEFHVAIALMVAAATLGSTYGQLYNQVRDFETDKKAGIVNVAIRLGERTTWVLAYIAVAATIICGSLAFTQMSFPNWLVLVVAGSTVVGMGGSILFNNTTDASGKPALDLTGRLQPGVWFAMTITIAVWVAWAMTVSG